MKNIGISSKFKSNPVNIKYIKNKVENYIVMYPKIITCIVIEIW